MSRRHRTPKRLRRVQRSFTPENVFDLNDEMDELAAACLAETKTKTFEAVTESRNWNEAASQRLDAMSREERLAYLKSLGERVRAEMQSLQNAKPAVGA